MKICNMNLRARPSEKWWGGWGGGGSGEKSKQSHARKKDKKTTYKAEGKHKKSRVRAKQNKPLQTMGEKAVMQLKMSPPPHPHYLF